MNAFVRLRAFGVVLAALSGACASAASFDCVKAKTPVELAICATPALSDLDVRMAQSYQRALRALSVEGAKDLRASQLEWLRFINRTCAPLARREPPNANGAAACIGRELQDRVDRLDQAGLRLGSNVLARVDRYNVLPGRPGDETGGRDGLVVHHVGFPQIDGGSPATTAWNAAQFKELPARGSEDNDEMDLDTDYIVGCANEHLLSIEWTAYQYSHGAAHGLYQTAVHTSLLAPEIRAMTSADLFAASSDWQAKLPTLFWQAYLRKENPNEGDHAVESAIREAAAQDGRWLLTPEGLQISFSAYEAGGYMSDPGPITVPWAELKALLASKDAPHCRFSSVGRH